MQGPQNMKFINAQQAKQIYRYKKIKEKLYKTNAAIWYNKSCKNKQLTPNYISINIHETSSTPILNATEGLAKMRVSQVQCLFETVF